MDKLNKEQEHIARHYDENSFHYEVDRLEKHCPAEFAITCRYLKRYVLTGAVVADVGVGAGHYAELLAAMGCSIYLVDISANLLKVAHKRLVDAGLHKAVLGVHRASAKELGCLDSSIVDVVLMLGPLYHLRNLSERQQAVKKQTFLFGV